MKITKRVKNAFVREQDSGYDKLIDLAKVMDDLGLPYKISKWKDTRNKTHTTITYNSETFKNDGEPYCNATALRYVIFTPELTKIPDDLYDSLLIHYHTLRRDVHQEILDGLTTK